jgi:hypothetical protein
MEFIALLQKERQTLEGRIKEIDKMLSQYRELERNAQALLSLTTSDQRSADSQMVATDDPSLSVGNALSAIYKTGLALPHRPREKTPTEEFEQAVIDLMRESDAPMDRSEIYDALMARGIVIGDGDKDKELNALSARLYRMAQAGHLVSKRGQGYRLNNRDPRERDDDHDDRERNDDYDDRERRYDSDGRES